MYLLKMRNLLTLLFSIYFIISVALTATAIKSRLPTVSQKTENINCSVNSALKEEIKSYASIVKLIKKTIVDDNGPLKNMTYNKLAKFVDDFGSRLSGTQNLENAIDFLLNELKEAKLDNVHGENVTVPHWIRGKESANLTKPRNMVLPILGLGGSVGTPASGVTAPVVVVRTFEELENASSEIPGKIVVFNEEYITYDKTVEYRSVGASKAAKLGAVAVLIRTIGPFSIASPHTGEVDYEEKVPKIPAACIATEYAEMLQRLYDRDVPLEINLLMEAHNESSKTSRNVVAEIKGKTEPEKVVLVSGHIDSWDVGQGAMDDGGGAFISWMSLVVLRSLNLQPRRTIRSVLWTAEEQGYVGSLSYKDAHSSEINNLTVVMESDEGTFTPTGLLFHGLPEAYCILHEIAKLMEPINATIVEFRDEPVESDITIWQELGVPGIGLRNNNERYFWFHHSNGDMMTVENPQDLNLCTALFTAVSYILADLSVELPKKLSLNSSYPSLI